MFDFLDKIGPPTWGDLVQVVAFIGAIVKLHMSNRERVLKLEVTAEVVKEELGDVNRKIDKVDEKVDRILIRNIHNGQR